MQPRIRSSIFFFYYYYFQSTFLLLIPSFQRFAAQALPTSEGLDLLKPPPVIARLQNIITSHGSRVSLLQFKPAKFILIIIRLTLIKKTCLLKTILEMLIILSTLL